LPYIDFLALQRRAVVVITDSGGIQEETTYLGVPCLTLRNNTERPVTVTLGTNIVVGHDSKKALV
jgi:UDP-N-acetylglucosamine 2-epimerase (non-hydrolysing)